MLIVRLQQFSCFFDVVCQGGQVDELKHAFETFSNSDSENSVYWILTVSGKNLYDPPFQLVPVHLYLSPLMAYNLYIKLYSKDIEATIRIFLQKN